MRIVVGFWLLAACVGLQGLLAKPTPFATIYLDYHQDLVRGGRSDPAATFRVERATFGFGGEGRLGNKKLPYEVALDVRSNSNFKGSNYWAPYLRVAFLEYGVGFLSMTVGLQDGQLFLVPERLMGLRVAAATYMELNEFGSASDFGVTLGLRPFREAVAFNVFYFNDLQIENAGLNLRLSTAGLLGFAEFILYGVVHRGASFDPDFRPGVRAKAERLQNREHIQITHQEDVHQIQHTRALMAGFRTKNKTLRGYVEFAQQNNHRFYGFTELYPHNTNSYAFDAEGMSAFLAWRIRTTGLLERFGLYARLDTNNSDVYDDEGDVDIIQRAEGLARATSGPPAPVSAGDSGLLTLWTGMEFLVAEVFEVVFSYRKKSRDAYQYEKKDVDEHAFLVDVGVQF